jgi:hypothetical protein
MIRGFSPSLPLFVWGRHAEVQAQGSALQNRLKGPIVRRIGEMGIIHELASDGEEMGSVSKGDQTHCALHIAGCIRCFGRTSIWGSSTVFRAEDTMALPHFLNQAPLEHGKSPGSSVLDEPFTRECSP